ncbi:MAG: hypothetical protein WEA09_13300 [Gemmatimonadota bacterium]
MDHTHGFQHPLPAIGPRVRFVRRPAVVLLGLSLLVAPACTSSDGATQPTPMEPTLHTLTVGLSGDGTGGVTSQPAGINCDSDGNGCSAEFEAGTSVTLTATPSATHDFTGWSGSCSGSGPCNLTVTANQNLGADFDNPVLVQRELGPDGGTLTSQDGGLTLTFPAGALTSTETISIERLEIGEPEGVLELIASSVGIAEVYNLDPSGIQFPVPVEVSVQMEPGPSDGEDPEEAGTLRVGGRALLVVSGTTVEPLGSLGAELDVSGPPAQTTLRMTGTLNHFSELVVTRDPLLTFSAFPIPDEEFVGKTWDVEAVVFSPGFRAPGSGRLGSASQRSATYLDASQAPLAALEPGPQAMGAEDSSLRSAVYSYRCLVEGLGRYESQAEVAVDVAGSGFSNGVVTLRLRKPVECIAPPQRTLTVNIIGSGEGSVASSPAGIACTSEGGTCEAMYDDGTEVTLTATPDQGSLFAGWYGGGGQVENNPAVKVTMTMDGAATACFIQDSPSELPLLGLVAVKSDPARSDLFMLNAGSGRPQAVVLETVFFLDCVPSASQSLQVAVAATSEGGRSISIAGDAPWVNVTGSLQADGSFTASGRGTVAGVPNIDVSFTGTFDEEAGVLTGDYAMDTGKVISASHPTVYSVNVKRDD